MRRSTNLILLVAGIAVAPLPAGAQCCTPAEVATLRDLNYLARVALNHQGELSQRLLAMNVAVSAADYSSWSDPDRGQLLSYMAATPAGKYWRALIDSFAALLGVTVRNVSVPPPLPAPTPASADTGTIEAAVRASVRDEIAALHVQIAALVTRLDALERGTGTAFSTGGAPGVTVPEGGNFILRSNLARNPTQTGITDSYCTMLGVNGWDGGFRQLQNWNHCGTRHLPYSSIGMDSMGDFSYSWFPAETSLRGNFPDNAPAAVHENPSHPLYSPYLGQALVISGGGQQATGYLTGAPLYASRNVMIAAQRAGQSLYFAVSPHRSSVGTPLNRALMKLEADPNFPRNPVHIVIDGELRRLKSCNVGGVTVVCF